MLRKWKIGLWGLLLIPLGLAGQSFLEAPVGADTLMLNARALAPWEASDSLWQALTHDLPYAVEGERLSRRLTLTNPTDDTLRLGLLVPQNDLVMVRTPHHGWQFTGHNLPLSRRSYYRFGLGLPLELYPQEKAQLEILMGAYDRQERVHAFPLTLSSRQHLDTFLHYRSLSERNSLALHYLFVGAVGIMMLYVFLLYLQNRQQSMYLYYGLYLLSMLLYIGPKVNPLFLAPDFFPVDYQLFTYTNEPVQWMLFVFYMVFVSHFLDLRSRSSRHFHLLRWVTIVYALYGIFTAVSIMVTRQLNLVEDLYVPSHLLAFLFGIYLILEFWLRLKGELRYYIVIGSVFFVAGSMGSMYYSVALHQPDLVSARDIPFQLDPIGFMKLGALAEVMCFSLGIGHRIRITFRQKAHVQRAYIQELKRNDALNRQIQQDLTEQVEKRSQEIAEKTRELEQERSVRIKASLEQELTRSQMTNLRLQMNPHFIFNALNSIRHLVLKKDFRTASAHIGDFARLLRLILQNTSQTTISLQNELDTLDLYLGFEQRRFGDRLSYEIEVGKGLNPDNVQIPPMLIQPFVENAVWHGLMHKDAPGKIWIDLRLDQEHLSVKVRDNGIGRKRSQEIRDRRSGNNKSYGLSITKDRLALMERFKQGKGKFEIEDLLNEKGEPAGTLVTMCIPL